ncbi:MAG TPA: sensor histidine kinase [Spirochaetia bacterium]|nr:sensor histidine kinase [Spirochaetia bacterium]
MRWRVDEHVAAWGTVAVALICRLTALMDFWRETATAGYPAQWPTQFTFLILLSIAVAIVCGLFHDRALALFSVFVLFVIDIVLSVPESDRIVLRFLLQGSDILIAMLCLRPYLNVVFSGLLVIAIYFLFSPVLVFGVPVLAPAIAMRLGFCAVLLLCGALGLGLKLYIEESGRRSEELSRLDTTITQLTRANIGFQEYAKDVAERSAETERKRISRDIHDTIGYTLTNIIMMTQEARLKALPFDEALSSLLETTRIQAQEGLRQTRRALRALRELVPGKLNIHQTVTKLAAAFANATGVEVTVEFGNMTAAVEEDTSWVIYRMVQEGMTNALRHGKATRIRILFWIDDDGYLMVDLLDNGRGSVGFEPGIGLSGMQERIEARRGRFQAGTVAGGFRLTAWFPAGKDSDDEQDHQDRTGG